MSEVRSVLVVDDEAGDLDLIANPLVSAGYSVVTAINAKEAVRKHAWYPAKIDLLVSDLDMAPMTGCDLAALLTTAQPDLPVLFVSGHAGEEVLRRNKAIPEVFFLRKPFTSDELLGKVREALGDGTRVLTARAHSSLEAA
jgi:two-component system, cell cycle sensor histidine kinase and response regulator CckA